MKMRKCFSCLVLLFVLLASMTVTAYAETSYGDAGWKVSFTEDKKMESNFKKADMTDVIYGMQPGDRAVITLQLSNENSTATDWYMTNKVLYSLEDRSANHAAGGAYTYILTYIDPEGKENILFSSDTVGGDFVSAAGEGLHAATNALEDYFYLDTLKKGGKGNIRLEVALDGETQGNDYQNTLADLQMNFAVELADAPSSNTPSANSTSSAAGRTRVVKTGDQSQLSAFVLAGCVSGAALLGISCYGFAKRRKGKEEVRGNEK